MFSKRGASLGILSYILIGAVVLFIAAVSLEATNVIDTGRIGGPLEKVATGVSNTLEPLFRVLVGFDRVADPANQSLLVLYFLLTAIICVRVIGSTGLTGGEDNKLSGLINLAVGIIIASIAVRAIPENMIQGMAGPSGGLVSALVIGIPFAILFSLSMTSKANNLVRKVLWLGYIAYLGALVFNDTIQDPGRLVIWIFVGLGTLMLFFDPMIRRWWFKEQIRRSISSAQADAALIQIEAYETQIEGYQKVIANPASTAAQVKSAETAIEKARAKIDKLSKY